MADQPFSLPAFLSCLFRRTSSVLYAWFARHRHRRRLQRLRDDHCQQEGENSIVVAPGANAKLSPADIDEEDSLIESASAVVMQLEVPLETIRHTIELCRRHGVFTILDPAPVPPRGLSRELLAVDVLTPNQGEAEMLVGQKRTLRVSKKRLSDPKVIGIELVARAEERGVEDGRPRCDGHRPR